MSCESSFWARRKAGVAAETRAAQAVKDAEALAEEQAALEEESDAEILARLELPDPETLKTGDDFAAFMARAVPDRIRRRALRTLWRSNPTLANVDMLVDYGEDFTDKATVIENLQTAYQVGKGMLKHVEEMTRQAEALKNASEAELEDEEAPEAEPAEAEEETLAEAPVAEPAEAEADISAEEYEVASVTAAPRRMKFRTEDQAA